MIKKKKIALSCLIAVTEPEKFVSLMDRLVSQETEGMRTNKVLKLLHKDLKTEKISAFIPRVQARQSEA